MASENLPADQIVQIQRWPDATLVAFMKCPRCDGRGYHWGFGELGLDPDWCENCGGGQTICTELLTPWET